VDLPDFDKESVAQIQILCTFQARGAPACRVAGEKPVRLHGAPAEKPTHPRSSRAQRTHKKSPDAAQ